MRHLSFLLAFLVTSVLGSLEAQTMKLTELQNTLLRPAWAGSPPADFDRIFIIEYRSIRILKDGAMLPEPFFLSTDEGDLTDIWSMTFHPDFAVNGRFYLVYNDVLADSGVAEFTVDPSDPNRTDYSSRGCPHPCEF